MSERQSIVDALAAVVPHVRAEFRDGREKTRNENPSGDVQSAADRQIDQLFREQLAPLEAVGAFASEERKRVEDVGDGYSVAIDPLDGSSNLRSNNIVGTVVGVYNGSLPASGRDLIASMVVLYGPFATITAAIDETVTRYVVDDGAIVDSSPVTIPAEGEICGFAGSTNEWPEAVEDCWRELHRDYKLRYTGAMVADINHLLVNGGLLGYPERSSSPNGDLRLQYEANPIAHIVETAGGRSSTGQESILDRTPAELHEHVPAYFGNPEQISYLESTLA
ncbi:fructose-1,6-bisphosphatase [Halostagnicola larsenii XH-48]|uniref:Fructose-1,6-bisphosphatase class 1 n=1 Tax=Halostagnicola larsenii XH-48 TaxID=797299 RepID=W0JRQ7_9EURY|nr:class 1 fructose-bisphosphatase [Halostagnicola larsenii]AHF99682.1 fructose-1,6-bisphosphatase [Halostagnicola larsenii XH-48]